MLMQFGPTRTKLPCLSWSLLLVRSKRPQYTAYARQMSVYLASHGPGMDLSPGLNRTLIRYAAKKRARKQAGRCFGSTVSISRMLILIAMLRGTIEL